ncbi:MAG: glycosyltransferase family 4 protein, partial [Deltaproteobacteria bacterium]|nr:glycosyltransferase family 4 protein [Deltaproteobacteria bacterium]
MKIALIRKEYDSSRGGAERYAVNLARGLAHTGHDVHIFAGAWENEDSSGITMHRVPFMRRPSPLKNLSFQRNSRRLVAGQTFDIVQGLSQVFPSDVYRMAEPLHAHWLRLHYMNPVKRWLKYLSPRHLTILGIESAIFKPGNYRRIIAISKLCRQQLIHYYGVPENAIKIIYNGVDLQQFSTTDHGRMRRAGRARLSIPEQEPVLLFAGNDFKRKGLQFGLQYALALRGRGHKPWLLVAGRGNQAPYMRMARQKNFAGRLVFLG